MKQHVTFIKQLALNLGLAVTVTAITVPVFAKESLQALGASAAVTDPTKYCTDKAVFVLMDVTGSFVKYLLQKEWFDGATNRIRAGFPKPLCIGSEVTVALIGHSHHSVTNSLDHLLKKSYTITRNQVTAENVVELVMKDLKSWRTQLANKEMDAQQNTALVMAFDNVADSARLSGKQAVIFAITDGEETELRKINPRKKGQLAGANVYMLGAGVTLDSGTEGQRKLRDSWERYFKTAGADQFHWVAKP